MTRILPQTTDTLNNPSHSFLHRVVSVDTLSPESSIDIDGSGNVTVAASIITQTLTGSTASSGNLTLQSTAHATKGKILFGTSAYDEVNNRLGIGTSSPSALFDIVSGGVSKFKVDSNGRVGFSDGSVSAPSIYFINEAGNNTGIYQLNQGLYFTINGSNVLSLTGTQIAGYSFRASTLSGSATVFDYALNNGSAADSGIFRINDGTSNFRIATNSVERLSILSNGNVGIGTTSPSYKLHVVGDSFSTRFLSDSLVNTGNGNTGFFTGAGTYNPYIAAIAGHYVSFTIAASEKMRVDSTGNVGIGVTSPTATLHLKAGTATAGTAPIKFTSGTLLTTAEAGAIEFLTDDWYATITTGAARKKFVLDDGTALTTGRVPFTTTNGRLTDYTGLTYASNVLKIGDGTNYAQFGADGTMTLAGTARVLEQIKIDAKQASKGVSAPTDTLRAVGASGGVLKPVTQFSKTVQQDIYFEFHAPFAHDISEPVEFHLVWAPGTGWTTGNYVWKLEYLVKDEDADLTTGTPTTISMDVTPANATNLIETVFTNKITFTNEDQILMCHFYRDVANDNADDTGDVNMLEINFIKNKQGGNI